MPRKSLDLTGQRYGYLTVLERVGSSPKGAALWLCHCSRCGQDCILEGQRIPQKTDCGCAYREKRADLTGQHIGVLQVIRRTGRSKHGDALYLCRCDLCGQEKEIPSLHDPRTLTVLRLHARIAGEDGRDVQTGGQKSNTRRNPNFLPHPGRGQPQQQDRRPGCFPLPRRLCRLLPGPGNPLAVTQV